MFLRLDIRKIGALDKEVSFKMTFNLLSNSTIFFSSTLSILVIATAPFLIPSKLIISRCSKVWVFGPSSAAITRRTKLTPANPEIIF